MIRIIRGFYGLEVDGDVRRIGPDDDPIQLSTKREKELIAAGIAEAVPESEKPKRTRKAKADEPDGYD